MHVIVALVLENQRDIGLVRAVGPVIQNLQRGHK